VDRSADRIFLSFTKISNRGFQRQLTGGGIINNQQRLRTDCQSLWSLAEWCYVVE